LWELIETHFKRYPSQEKVAKTLVNLGLRVDNDKMYCGNIELSDTAIARALDVDRRIVSSTIKTIKNDPKLESVFKRLSPTCTLKDVAPLMGWSVLEIMLSDITKPGLLGKIATEIGNGGVSIRQAIGEDPQYSEGRVFIITETAVPPDVLLNIRKIKGVESVTLH
jgi:predicted regulator of amino acid metabolism with ACT domain